jgi:hypothetical protein
MLLFMLLSLTGISTTIIRLFWSRSVRINTDARYQIKSAYLKVDNYPRFSRLVARIMFIE